MSSTPTSNPPRKKKVAIIGLDGCRPDSVLPSNAPVLHAIAKEGFYSWHAMTENHSVSGPAWTSLLTGVHFDKHKVTDNDFKPRDLKYRTIFYIARQQFPKLRTVAHSHWEPIIGDIFEPGTLNIKSSGGDKKMAYRFAKDIEKDKGDLYFIQLDDIDGAGHSNGYGPDIPDYLKRIQITDGYVGSIWKAIKARPPTEEWLMIVISDHGGSGKSHGLPTIDCMRVILLITGNSIAQRGEIPYDKEEEEFPQLVDVVPTIAKFLNIPPLPDWDGISRI